MLKNANKNSTSRFALLLLTSLTVAIFGVGCSDDEDPTSNENLTPTQQVEQAWNYFEEREYTQALREFEDALSRDGRLSDAWNGKGWALGKIPNSRLDEASFAFARALREDTTRYDALGGWAFAVYHQNDWAGAIRKCDSLLYRRPGWRFLHESTLNEDDLQLLKAAAHYNLGEYSSSYEIIVEHLNPAFEADITTPAGRRELLDEIERLRRVNG